MSSDYKVVDEDLFSALSVPHANLETCTENCQKFYSEVMELRKKYRIPEVVIAHSANYLGKNGETKIQSMVGFRGGEITDSLILALLQKTRLWSKFVSFITEMDILNSRLLPEKEIVDE